jgi:hypothetical protein
MKKNQLLMAMALVLSSFYACTENNTTTPIDTTNNGTFKVYTLGDITSVQNLIADTIIGTSAQGQPVGTGHFTFFSLKNRAIVPLADSATNNWDIAFRGTTILTNAGTSGPGMGGAYVHVGVFADVIAFNADSTIRTDAAPVYAIKTGSNKGWYVYDGPNNLITPIPGRVLMIRGADGSQYKLEINNYYKGGVTPLATATDAIKLSTQRYYNFRYLAL